MVTPLILFNRFWAFRIWTWLCICNHPSNVVRLISIFLFPFFGRLTITRPMRTLWASKAKPHPTLTRDILNRYIFTLNAVLTAWSWTPFDALVVISEALAVKLHILLQAFSASFINLLPDWVGYFHRTFELWTVRMETNLSKLHSLTEVVPPAVLAKCVSASHP